MSTEHYVRKSIPLQVAFATTQGELQTLEGLVAYRPGDALVTGVAGERWPVARERFERTYHPADEDGAMGRDGCFVRDPMVVRAARLPLAQRVEVGGGRGWLQARPGDWLLTGPDGETWVVADGIFQQTYEQVAGHPS